MANSEDKQRNMDNAIANTLAAICQVQRLRDGDGANRELGAASDFLNRAETLLQHYRSMTHARIPVDEQQPKVVLLHPAYAFWQNGNIARLHVTYNDIPICHQPYTGAHHAIDQRELPVGRVCGRCLAKVKQSKQQRVAIVAAGAEHATTAAATARMHQEKSQQDAFNGIGWHCSACQAPVSFDSAWRWNGHAWEHKCAEYGPQVGHFAAVKA